MTLTIPQARYLKHSGKTIDVKVTIRISEGEPVIYIRDCEFHSFQTAIRYLQHIVETEVAREEVQK